MLMTQIYRRVRWYHGKHGQHDLMSMKMNKRQLLFFSFIQKTNNLETATLQFTYYEFVLMTSSCDLKQQHPQLNLFRLLLKQKLKKKYANVKAFYKADAISQCFLFLSCFLFFFFFFSGLVIGKRSAADIAVIPASNCSVSFMYAFLSLTSSHCYSSVW